MRKLIALLLAASIITCCKNQNKPAQNSGNPNAGITADSAKSPDTALSDSGLVKAAADTSSYHWSKRDQDNFIKDCVRNASGEVDEEHIKEFCSCMLIQSQRYYTSYRQMEDKSNEDHDREIFLNCLHKLPEQEEENDPK